MICNFILKIFHIFIQRKGLYNLFKKKTNLPFYLKRCYNFICKCRRMVKEGTCFSYGYIYTHRHVCILGCC